MNSIPPNAAQRETGLLLAWDATKAIVAEKQKITNGILDVTGWQVSLDALAHAVGRIYRAAHPDSKAQGCARDTVRSVRDARLPPGVKYAPTKQGRWMLLDSTGTPITLTKIRPSEISRAASHLGIEITHPAKKAPKKAPSPPASEAETQAPPEAPPTTIVGTMEETIDLLARHLRGEGLTTFTLTLRPGNGYRFTTHGPGGAAGGRS